MVTYNILMILTSNTGWFNWPTRKMANTKVSNKKALYGDDYCTYPQGVLWWQRYAQWCHLHQYLHVKCAMATAAGSTVDDPGTGAVPPHPNSDNRETIQKCSQNYTDNTTCMVLSITLHRYLIWHGCLLQGGYLRTGYLMQQLWQHCYCS